MMASQASGMKPICKPLCKPVCEKASVCIAAVTDILGMPLHRLPKAYACGRDFETGPRRAQLAWRIGNSESKAKRSRLVSMVRASEDS